MIDFFKSVTLLEWAFLYWLMAMSFGYWSYAKYRVTMDPNYAGVKTMAEWATIAFHSTFLFPVILSMELHAWNRRRKMQKAILRAVDRAMKGENCPEEGDEEFTVKVAEFRHEKNNSNNRSL